MRRKAAQPDPFPLTASEARAHLDDVAASRQLLGGKQVEQELAALGFSQADVREELERLARSGRAL